MSLLNWDSLEIVIDLVHHMQIFAEDHLTLAIPYDDLLSQYEAQLLGDVNTLPQGLLLTKSIPLASSQTTFTVYESITLRMPQPDSPGVAIMWDQAPFLAISDDGRQTATLSRDQLSHCIGSSRYGIYDSQSCLALATRDDNSAKTKHFATRMAYVREIVKNQSIDLKFIASGDNCADIFTKGLGKTKTQQHLARLSAKRGCQGLPSASQGGNDQLMSDDP